MQLYYFVGPHLNQCGRTSGGRIVNQPDPIQDGDAATKGYIDRQRLRYYKEKVITLTGTQAVTIDDVTDSTLVRLQIFPRVSNGGPAGVFQLNRAGLASTLPVVPSVESYTPGGTLTQRCDLRISWPFQQPISIQKTDAQCDGAYVVLQYG